MKCSVLFAQLVLASVLLPLFIALVSWMRTLVDERDAASLIGFVGWSAFFFYLMLRGILSIGHLCVDKSRPVK